MQVAAIKTPLFHAPQTDMFAVFDTVDFSLAEKSVVVVTSKIVALHQGRTVKKSEVDKRELAKAEADYWYTGSDAKWPIGIKYHALLLAAGIDDSNVENEYYVLLPDHPLRMASEIKTYLQRRFNVNELGVIISDSHSAPMRYGTLGIGIGWAGIEPVRHHEGDHDLYESELKITRINVIDSLAGMGVFAMGETTEQTPLALISELGNRVSFTDQVPNESDLLIPPQEDIYWPLLRKIIED